MVQFFIGLVVGLWVYWMTLVFTYFREFVLRNRVIGLVIISAFALAQALFVQLPQSSVVLSMTSFYLVAAGVIVFTAILAPYIKAAMSGAEISPEKKALLQNTFFSFITIHTLAEGIGIGLKSGFSSNLTSWEVLIEMAHEIPEVAFLIALYSLVMNDKWKLNQLLFITALLYPISALVTNIIVSQYDPVLNAYIKSFLLGWYFVFGTLVFANVSNMENGKQRVSYSIFFVSVFLLMFFISKVVGT